MFGRVLVAAALALLAGGPSGRAQQLGPVPQTAAPAAAPAAAEAAAAASGPKALLSDRSGKLGTIDLGNGAIRIIGSTGKALTDIAYCRNGTLYGISFSQLFRINPSTAQATLIGSHHVSGLNALVCNAANQLLAHSTSVSRLYPLNAANAAATLLGTTGSLRSAGDLTYHENALFLSTSDRKLARLNKANGAVLGTKSHGITDLFGLVSTGTNKLYGFAGTSAYRLNEDTGGRTLLFNFSGKGLQQIYGAAYNGNFQQ